MKQSTTLPIQCSKKNTAGLAKKICRLACVFLAITFISCSQKTENRVVIWTTSPEFAQYIVLFNKAHQENKAVLVYKENPIADLPPARDEEKPDIVIGPYLRNDKTAKNFKSLDYFFERKILSSDDFYPQLIEAGKIRMKQYLLPVSFNLPAVIFSETNKNLVEDNYTLSLDQIRATASAYNAQNKKGQFTKMGFTPLAYSDFLYLTACCKGADFAMLHDGVTYNGDALKNSIAYLKNWSQTENSSTQVEQDFAYKYLFMPDYRQVDSGRCLFSYTTSDELFRFMKDTSDNIDYRWICENDEIPMEDSFVMLGIYKYAKNFIGATEFVSWFLQSENQKAILERKASATLDTEKFGIAGGFSAVSDVNEHILPVYYTKLLSNIPPAEMIKVPNQLPPKWESYKTSVIEQYIKDSVVSEEELNMADYIKAWQKQM